MRKGQEQVFKLSTYTVRLGVDYDHIGAVQLKREDGRLPEVNAGLPWGEWIEFPYTIAHRGEVYVRCTLAHNTAHRGHTSYQLADGTAIDSQQVQIMALASEFPQGERENDVFTIKLSSITEIH
jgi:hypothetical protein